MNNNKKNQQGFALEFLLIGLAVALLIGAGIYAMLVLFPKQQVNNAATAFIETSVDGDYEDVIDLANTENEQEETAVKQFAEDIDDGVGSDEYKIRSTEIDGDKATVIFEVNEDKDKTIRLELKKVEGKWLVEGVYYSLDEVESSSESNNSTPAETPVASAPQACLPAASLEKFWRYKSGWQFYFAADSNDLEFGTSTAVQNVKEMKEFYNDNKQYNFTFVIDVSLYQATGSASDIELAKSRGGIVAYNMYLAGIPYENIRFGEAISAGNPDTPQYATGSRNATVEINSSCDAQSAPQDYNSENAGR